MYLADAKVTPRRGTNAFEVFAIGDLHADSKAFDEDRLKAWIAHIAERGPSALAVCVGDYCNGQVPGHKHFDPDATRPDYLVNLDGYVKHGLAHCERLFAPLKKAKVPTVMVEGNHDRMMGAVGFTPMLADRVGATYLGASGFVRVGSKGAGQAGGGVGEWTTIIFAHHGSKGGSTPGPKVNAMHALMGWIDADVFIAGHVHDADLRVVERYGVARKGERLDILASPVALYRAPSFLARAPVGVSLYPDRKEYGTADRGLQWLEVNPRMRTLRRHEFVPAVRAA